MRRALGGGKAARKTPSLPSPFQSVAQQAFNFDEPVAPKPSPPANTAPRRLFGRLKLKYRVLIGLAVAGGGTLTLMFAAMMVYYTVVFPDPLAIRANDRTPVIRILARDGSVLAERGATHEYLPLDRVPNVVPAAVIATEDRRFFEHYGVDPAGMIRAMFANLRAGRYAQGGSTLTQQLAKNLFLTQERNLTRKVAELGLALWLEIRLTKREILELYLNQVYLGGGAYGVAAASERYFDKPARDLTLAEAAIIAGLLKAPSKYSPATNPGAARARGRVVLQKMLEAGFISEADEARALAQTIVFSEHKEPKADVDSGYVIDYILEKLPPLSGAGDGDVIIETTLDKNLQRRAQEIVSDTLAKRGAAFGASQAAMVVLDGEGGVRALVGGRDYATSQFNRAVKAKRQPGSSFKPFVYLAALERGLTPDSITIDQPITIGNWSPKNDDNQYLGAITLRQALAQSVNTVAARLNRDVGPGRTIEVARRLGINSELHEGASLALGTSEVTLLEMAGAYAVFSNGGAAVEPHVISRVRLGSGQILYTAPPPRTDRVVDATKIGALNDMLNAAVVYGTGRRAALPDQPVGGKTGTTQDFRDAWFIGFTSRLTAGVWVGNDDGKPMLRTTGGSLPAEIWNQVMRVAERGAAPEPLPGTVIAEGSPFADGSAAEPAWAPTGPHAPRVVEGYERLPWAIGDNLERFRPASSDVAGHRTNVIEHPAKGIGADFIARALSGTESDDDSTTTAESVEADDRSRKSHLFSWW